VDALPATSTASADYQVGPGDVLAVSVYRQPDLPPKVVVGPDGTITLGALRAIKVENLTANQIADRIAHELKAGGILLAPSVNVSVTDIRSKQVSVMGSISRPGQIPLDHPNMMLSEVLAKAGATFGTGAGIVTVLSRNDSPNAPREQFSLSALVSGTRDRPARPGETLVVQSAPTIYVSGEVGKPGGYPMEPNMTVGRAIALGGGVTPRGSSGRIVLQREGAGGKSLIKVDQGDTLQPNDLIIVKRRVF